ncbi:PAS domain S-box protein, partial [Mariprofundus ferrooxydans]|nr:PAS domain S-box protein [Mariprofundus ferrooxydans]
MEHPDSFPYKKMIERSFDAIVCSNETGLIQSWNPAAERMFRYKASEALNQPITMLIPADDQQKHAYAFKQFLVTGKLKSPENILKVHALRKDGSSLPIEMSLSADKTTQGWSFTAVLRDISKRIQSDKKVQQYKHQQQASSALSMDALAGMALDELFQKTTQVVADTLEIKCCKVLELQADRKSLLLRAGIGWKQGLVGHTTVPVESNSQAGFTLQSHQPVVVQDLCKETRFKAPQLLQDHNIVSGISVVIEGTDHPWGVLGCHATTCRCFSHDDIDFIQVLANILALAIEHKQNKLAVLSTQMKHQEALRMAQLGYRELDLINKHIIYSTQARHILEFEIENQTISHDCFLHSIHQEDREATQSIYTNALKTKQPYSMTYRLLMPDGRIKWIYEQGKTIFASDGQALKSMAIMQDISERKKAEKKLQLISQLCATASGEAFFPALVKSTAQALESTIVFVAELLPQSIPTARTLALSIDQTLIKNIEYPLAGTPCEQIIKGQTLSFNSGLQASFPEDHWLVDMHAESYVGVPMLDDDGRVIGHMGVMDNKPIRNQQQIIDTLIIFAERAATELKQKRSDASLRKLSQAIEYAGESILITDRNGIIEYINPAFTQISGYAAAEAIGQTPRILNSGNQDKAFYQSMWKSIISGEVWHNKVIDRKKDGS